MRATLTLGLVALGSLAAGFWLASLARPARLAPQVPSAAAAKTSELPAPVVPAQRAALSPPSADAAVVETAGEFLSDYYGSQWPAVRARMEAAGVRLDEPFSLTPWEQVEDDFRAQVVVDESMRARILKDRFAWTETLTNDWLRQEFPNVDDFELAPQELAEVEALILADRLEFEVVAEAFCDRLDFHLRAAFEQGRYQRVPYTNQGLAEPPGFYSTAVAGHGWAVSVTLHEESCPDARDLRHEMEAIVHRRDRRVAQFLRDHPRR